MTPAAPLLALSPHLARRQRPIRIVHHRRAIPRCVQAIDLLQPRVDQWDAVAMEEVSRLGNCLCTELPRFECLARWGLAARVLARFEGDEAA